MVIFKVAGSTILIILNSYLLLLGRYHNHHHQKVFSLIIKTLQGIKEWRKIFQLCVCQSEISRNIFTARSLQALHSELKRKHVQDNNLFKTVEITAKKYYLVLTIPNMVVVLGPAHISFMLI